MPSRLTSTSWEEKTTSEIYGKQVLLQFDELRPPWFDIKNPDTTSSKVEKIPKPAECSFRTRPSVALLLKRLGAC
jgi:hypothetical protein